MKVLISLTEEDKKLMRLLVTDMTAQQIAKHLEMDYFACQHAISRLALSFKVRGRVGIVRMAFISGLVIPSDFL